MEVSSGLAPSFAVFLELSMMSQGVLSVVGRGVWRVGAVLLGAGWGCDELRGGWGWVLCGNEGGDVPCACDLLLFTRYVITYPDIVLPPSRLGSLLSVRGVEIYSGWL